VRWFCFYTVDSPYEREAGRCRDAFKQYAIDVNVVPYAAQGTWMRNCLKRANMLHTLGGLLSRLEPLGLIDSDMRPVKDPVLLRDFDGDFAAHFRGAQERLNRRYCAGVLIFGATPVGRAILADWADLCERDPTPDAKVREQVYLAQAATVARTAQTVNFLNLGEAYNTPWEGAPTSTGTVLIHWESSRLHAAKMGGPAW
jgi:hypothetical protein